MRASAAPGITPMPLTGEAATASSQPRCDATLQRGSRVLHRLAVADGPRLVAGSVCRWTAQRARRAPASPSPPCRCPFFPCPPAGRRCWGCWEHAGAGHRRHRHRRGARVAAGARRRSPAGSPAAARDRRMAPLALLARGGVRRLVVERRGGRLRAGIYRPLRLSPRSPAIPSTSRSSGDNSQTTTAPPRASAPTPTCCPITAT